MPQVAIGSSGPGLLAPPGRPATIVEPGHGLVRLDLRAVWEYRELLYFLIWREVKVRYKQTAIGTAWAVIQPLLTMVIFTIVFSKFARVPSDGLPYPIFAFTALLPWTYFSQAITRTSDSVVADAHLIRKIYFPRLILPLSSAISPLVDFAVAFVVLVGMMVWFGSRPTVGVLFLPAFLLLALVTALAVGLWLSAFNVRYRDVKHTVPFLAQIWMYASPVAYPVSLVPEHWQFLYAVNPMVGVIEGFRWALLGNDRPHFGVIALSAAMLMPLLLSGLLFFKRTERSFDDLI